MSLEQYQLNRIADQVGTPFYLYDGDVLREKLSALRAVTDGSNLICRYAIKANAARRVLTEVRAAGLWIDAVSGNEVLRALRAGFPGGSSPPTIMLTSDVFRDNALTTVLEHQVLPNVGSPGMIRELRDAGYRGPIALRVNPGFGHGHVKACDTGGPSSKHGIWSSEMLAARAQAEDAKLPVVALHAHVGTGPELREFDANMRRLVDFYAQLLPEFPEVEAVNLGGGLPHPYRPGAAGLRPQLVPAGAAGGGGAAGQDRPAPNAGGDRAGPLSSGRHGPAGGAGEGHQADAGQRQGAGQHLRDGRRRIQ